MDSKGHTLFQDDRALLDKYRHSGDIGVLGDLYKRYMPLVYGVCMKYLNDREESKDAVMEIFEKLVVELAAKEVDNFRPWLYVVAKNHCLMKMRKTRSRDKSEKRYMDESLIFMESEAFAHPLDEPVPEMDKLLKECIGKLKNEQKDCIHLFYFEELSYREIAEKLGLEIKKVKSFIQNGKRNLKNCIEEESEKEKRTY